LFLLSQVNRTFVAKTFRAEVSKKSTAEPSSRTPSGRKKLYPLIVCTEQLLAERPGLTAARARELVAAADHDLDDALTFEELFALIQAPM
jgi:hypothetical protein